MTDIVERLETFGDANSWALRGDAAEEIMRLRAQRDRLRAALRLASEYVGCGASILKQIDAAVAAVEDRHD